MATTPILTSVEFTTPKTEPSKQPKVFRVTIVVGACRFFYSDVIVQGIFNWADLERGVHDPITNPSSYRLYTVVSLGETYIIFLALLALHILLIWRWKRFASNSFRSCPLIDQIFLCFFYTVSNYSAGSRRNTGGTSCYTFSTTSITPTSTRTGTRWRLVRKGMKSKIGQRRWQKVGHVYMSLPE